MFPQLQEPTLFLASPGDVADLRGAIKREFDALQAQVANDLDVGVYSWSVDISADGFDDAVPAQQQIYCPSDPLCRALICVLGEKLGTPLGFDVPEGSIDLPPCGGFEFVHPWRHGAEEHGGFPLTGTVFEFVSALAGARRPPTLLLVVGDDTIINELDPLNANWGFGRLLESGRGRFGQRKKDLWAWERQVYSPQLLQLANFVRYLRCRGLVDTRNLVTDEMQVRERVRSWLKTTFNYQTRADHRDPFKSLEPYDVADMHVFFGRSEWRRSAIRAFQRLWTERGRVPFFGIIGGSGTGKSSLLRAGMIRPSAGPQYARRFLRTGRTAGGSGRYANDRG